MKVDRGLNKLISASGERGDGKYKQLANLNAITIHVQCLREYTRPSNIKKTKRKHESSEPPGLSIPLKQQMRSLQPPFEFKTYMFHLWKCGRRRN